MRNHILLITALQFLYVASRSIEPIDGPLWLDRLSDLIKNEEIYGPYFDNLSESDISVKEKRTFLSSLRASSEKRALSMFARWGPINTIGKERNPIRSGYPPKTFNTISAQTRSRLLGQPLRWG